MVGGVYEAAYAGPAPVTIDSTADTGEGLDWGGSGRSQDHPNGGMVRLGCGSQNRGGS